jgi:hypothetical protein
MIYPGSYVSCEKPSRLLDKVFLDSLPNNDRFDKNAQRYMSNAKVQEH